jgi:endoglucanase
VQQNERHGTTASLKSPAKRAMGVFCAALLCICIVVPRLGVAANADWEQFLRRHVHLEGRVIDDGAGGISHSEGQGFGMLLSVHFEDRESFERLYRWTRKNLMIRDDGLLAWRWVPQLEVTDRNNATDGDILVAWALMRAGALWNSREYLDAGIALARTVREKLIRRTPKGVVILPGMQGFEHSDALVLNLSYWVFPAFTEFSRTERSPVWAELIQNGYRLLAEARFGRWGLPPDWLRQSEGKLTLPDDKDPRYGYDAIRIPLYLLWNGADRDAIQPFRSFSAHFAGASFVPAWTNLKDDSVDPHDAIKGMRAIAALTGANPNLRNIVLPEMDESQSYYSDALLLLVKMMLWERAGR